MESGLCKADSYHYQQRLFTVACLFMAYSCESSHFFQHKISEEVEDIIFINNMIQQDVTILIMTVPLVLEQTIITQIKHMDTGMVMGIVMIMDKIYQHQVQ